LKSIGYELPPDEEQDYVTKMIGTFQESVIIDIAY